MNDESISNYDLKKKHCSQRLQLFSSLSVFSYSSFNFLLTIVNVILFIVFLLSLTSNQQNLSIVDYGRFDYEELSITKRTSQSITIHSNQSIISNNETHFNEHFFRNPWDDNWDSRDIFSLINRTLYDVASPQEQRIMRQNVTASVPRTIILIRHGEYGENLSLTELGREQARLTGVRLRELTSDKSINYKKVNRVIMSTMTRAIETAHIIIKELSEVASEREELLTEGRPYPTEPPQSAALNISNEKFYDTHKRVEAAFTKYFKRSDPNDNSEITEVLVCHANVIRYLVLRSLQLPPERWSRLLIGHSSITIVRIRSNGFVNLLLMGDVGHLKPHQMTGYN